MSRVPSSVLTILASDPAVARSMGTARRKVLTALLLSIPVDALDLVRWFRKAVIDGRFSSDPALVFGLFRKLDRRGRIELATSLCAAALDTRSFVRLVTLTHQTCSPNGQEKDRLAGVVSLFTSTHWNITARPFEALVRNLLASRRSWDRAHGLLCLSALSRASAWHVQRVTQLVRDSAPHVRANAWIAASSLAIRGMLSGAPKESLLRDSLAARHDEHQSARKNARWFRRYAHGQVRR
jgi:hypothetical protein